MQMWSLGESSSPQHVLSSGVWGVRLHETRTPSRTVGGN